MNRPIVFLGYLTLLSLILFSYFSISPQLGWSSSPSAPAKDMALPHHYAFHDCAPWDGPAVHLAFQKRAIPDGHTPPLISVGVWLSNPPLHQWIPVGNAPDANNNGHASWCPKKDGCISLEGEIRFETFTATHLKGTFRLRIPKAGVPSMPIDFDLDYTRPGQPAMCG